MNCRYYSGFCLRNEKELFKEYLIENDFTISGFSYGSMKAFKKVLKSEDRIDLLQLFSPIFFQSEKEEFKKAQLFYFKKDMKIYCDNFLKNIMYPENININKYFSLGKVDELEELLNFTWDKKQLQKIVDNGTKIEVYLGKRDKIIDSSKAKDFFKDFSTVYFFNKKGHLLI